MSVSAERTSREFVEIGQVVRIDPQTTPDGPDERANDKPGGDHSPIADRASDSARPDEYKGQDGQHIAEVVRETGLRAGSDQKRNRWQEQQNLVSPESQRVSSQ